jgi:hypothetical protein
MTKADILTPLLEIIAALLKDASAAADQAADAIAHGNQNRAIGTLMPAQEALAAVDGLLRAALTLHRHGLKGGVA